LTRAFEIPGHPSYFEDDFLTDTTSSYVKNPKVEPRRNHGHEVAIGISDPSDKFSSDFVLALVGILKACNAWPRVHVMFGHARNTENDFKGFADRADLIGAHLLILDPNYPPPAHIVHRCLQANAERVIAGPHRFYRGGFVFGHEKEVDLGYQYHGVNE